MVVICLCRQRPLRHLQGTRNRPHFRRWKNAWVVKDRTQLGNQAVGDSHSARPARMFRARFCSGSQRRRIYPPAAMREALQHPMAGRLKIDSAGSKVLGAITSGGEHSDSFSSLVYKRRTGVIYLTGTSYTPVAGIGDTGHFGGDRWWLVKVDAHRKARSGSDSSAALGNDRSLLYRWVGTMAGGVILGGSLEVLFPSGNKESPLLGGYDYWLVKADAIGNKQWDQKYRHDLPSEHRNSSCGPANDRSRVYFRRVCGWDVAARKSRWRWKA